MSLRVVILGGGFGGLYAARAFRHENVEVTLIDRRNFHLFQPLLYQVATGELSPADVAFPLRAIFSKQKNVSVLLGEATGLDAVGKRIILEDGHSVPYDALIVATGARNHYFGNEAWAEKAPGLKSLEEATRIRHRILYAFEAAERSTDAEEHRAWLTFVIVGAGPTGVELAGAIGEIANDTLRDDFRRTRPEESRILLLDDSPRVLSPFEPSLSAHAEKALIRLGVRSLLGVRVTGVDESGVTIRTAHGEEHIRACTVLWAAGVSAAGFSRIVAEATGAEIDRGGRVVVDTFCNVPGHPEIYVIGDGAQFLKDGKPLPGVAPVAMQQGRYVAKTIVARHRTRAVQPFKYWDKGSLAVIGRASAVAQFPRLKLHGPIAWLSWLFIHLMYLVGFQNRIIVFIRWAFNYFTYNRGARLITGEPDPAVSRVTR
ncbi:MAG TPA: NAD(P)/FAD-dependent oxidoreductase [Bryobacteraceae bacterium]|nr:NAD(P)/FAD-dependent oxidoreductase [Bryobacteraceae bacterium]